MHNLHVDPSPNNINVKLPLEFFYVLPSNSYTDTTITIHIMRCTQGRFILIYVVVLRRIRSPSGRNGLG